MNSRQLGILGEKIARGYLKRKGYKVLEKNYSPKFVSGPVYGEIDIVAKKEDIISFVEVKTQISNKGDQNFFPENKVNFLKQRKIIKTSQAYLLEEGYPPETKWQVDVLGIVISPEKNKAKIRHIKNAVPNIT